MTQIGEAGGRPMRRAHLDLRRKEGSDGGDVAWTGIRRYKRTVNSEVTIAPAGTL